MARKTGQNITLPIAASLRSHILAVSVSFDPKTPLHRRSFASLQRQKGNAGNLSNQFSQILAEIGLREPLSRRGNKNGRNAKRTTNELSFHCLRHPAVTRARQWKLGFSVFRVESIFLDSIPEKWEPLSRWLIRVNSKSLFERPLPVVSRLPLAAERPIRQR